MTKQKSQKSKKTAVAKPSLAWVVADFLASGEEPPACVIQGTTEGQAMSREEAIDWIGESMRCLRVMAEEYPEGFAEQKAVFEADLAYLVELDKISKEEMKDLMGAQNYVFTEETDE